MTVARTRLTLSILLLGLLVSACNSQPAEPPTTAAQPSISDPMISDPTPQEPGKEVGISIDVSSAGGATLTYTWNADGGEIVRGQGSPAITYRVPEEPGTYNVRVRVEWDGQSVEKATTIQVEGEVTAPTATPKPTAPPEPTEPEPTSTSRPEPEATSTPKFAIVPTVASASEGLNTVYYYGFNTTLPPFDDVLVRQAFALALDREALSQIASDSAEDSRFPATTFTPPDILGVDLYRQVGLPHDPDRARDLLAQAGYPDGSGLPAITLWYNESEGDYHRPIAEAAREQWREVLGVEVSLRSKPWGDYLDMIYSTPPQIWRLGWSLYYVDPHDFLYDALCGDRDDDFLNNKAETHLEYIKYAPDEAARRDRITEFSESACERFNPTRSLWDNPEYNSLVQTALQELDEDARRELYIRAERILCETDAVVIPIYHYHYE
jgi:ABC-type transport system substrate-binding protein